MQCSWREASTIILTAFNKASVKNWNYMTLTLERSKKSSFMPSGYVFPGGTTEPSDCDKKWLDLFSNFNLNISNMVKIRGTTPPIISNNTGDVPKLLSLKITAIRETFEETGILLCQGKEKMSDSQKWISCSAYEGLDSWRSKVQKDASEFLNLCLSYNCCPDVRNLHLWSNWLTPTSMGNKRFDTAFFIACLSENTIAVADKTEVEKLIWQTPEDIMKSCQMKNIWLPPPQVYETGRLLQFKDIMALNDFAISRSTEGCERWMPVQIKTLDGSVSVLPGDDAYTFSDYCTPTEPAQVKMTNEQFRSESKILHRMEFKNKVETKLVVQNYTPTNGHILPVGEC